MKVFVTGAAGFIGSSLCESLLGDGVEVLGLDNFDDFYSPALKRANLRPSLQSRRFRLVEGDFRDPELLDRILAEARPEAVVHLGARAGVRPSLEQAPLYVDVNVTGTARLLDSSRRHGVQRFLFASSSSVYGKRPVEPFAEEDDADHPVSPYAATKRAGELLCSTHHQLWGLPITCLRFFTVYGPRQRPEMAIHAFARRIAAGEPIAVFGDGSALRDFTYIADIIAGVRAALDRCAGFRILNLGCGRTVRVMDAIRLLEAELGREARIEFQPVEPGDVPVTLANVSAARRELGYEPKVVIEEGIRRFVEWFREQPAG
jgi:UDP-glucuronate 4-epimerase